MSDSLIETRNTSRWAAGAGMGRRFLYTGPSMRPTLRPGDLLYVRPVASPVTPGDVVVYQDDSSPGFVVHRVYGCAGPGYRTRGDNNAQADLHPVPLAQMVGRVAIVDRAGRRLPLRAGRPALWAARLRWFTMPVYRRLARIAAPPYRALRASATVRRFLARCLGHRLATVRLETPDGPIIKTLCHGSTVAIWQPLSNRFVCRKPYDLVIPHPGPPGP